MLFFCVCYGGRGLLWFLVLIVGRGCRTCLKCTRSYVSRSTGRNGMQVSMFHKRQLCTSRTGVDMGSATAVSDKVSKRLNVQMWESFAAPRCISDVPRRHGIGKGANVGDDLVPTSRPSWPSLSSQDVLWRSAHSLRNASRD